MRKTLAQGAIPSHPFIAALMNDAKRGPESSILVLLFGLMADILAVYVATQSTDQPGGSTTGNTSGLGSDVRGMNAAASLALSTVFTWVVCHNIWLKKEAGDSRSWWDKMNPLKGVKESFHFLKLVTALSSIASSVGVTLSAVDEHPFSAYSEYQKVTSVCAQIAFLPYLVESAQASSQRSWWVAANKAIFGVTFLGKAVRVLVGSKSLAMGLNGVSLIRRAMAMSVNLKPELAKRFNDCVDRLLNLGEMSSAQLKEEIASLHSTEV